MKSSKYFLPVIIVGVGALLFGTLVATRPEPPRVNQVDYAPLVRVEAVAAVSAPYLVRGTGIVSAAREAAIVTEVSGPVIWISEALRPGGHFVADAPMFRIENERYQWAVARRRAELAQAQTELRLEQGRGELARRDWEASPPGDRRGADRELALRQPQLATARAALAAAQAGLDEAELNLARTTVRAPFAGSVQSEDVTLGQFAQAGREVARLLDVDSFWIEVTVPVTELVNIELPDTAGDRPGSAVIIFQRGGADRNHRRDGRVLGLFGGLDPGSRMARLLVEVSQPLAAGPDGAPPLLVGEQVELDIVGRTLDQVIRVPRTALMADDSVWALSDEHRLNRRRLELVWRGADHVLASAGLDDGELVVIGTVARVTEGTRVRLLTDEQPS